MDLKVKKINGIASSQTALTTLRAAADFLCCQGYFLLCFPSTVLSLGVFVVGWFILKAVYENML